MRGLGIAWINLRKWRVDPAKVARVCANACLGQLTKADLPSLRRKRIDRKSAVHNVSLRQACTRQRLGQRSFRSGRFNAIDSAVGLVRLVIRNSHWRWRPQRRHCAFRIGALSDRDMPKPCSVRGGMSQEQFSYNSINLPQNAVRTGLQARPVSQLLSC